MDRWQASELDTNVSTIVLMPTLQSCAVLWNMAKLGLEKLTTPTHADKALLQLHGRSSMKGTGSCEDPPRSAASETHQLLLCEDRTPRFLAKHEGFSFAKATVRVVPHAGHVAELEIPKGHGVS